MNEDLNTQRILESVMQIILSALCFVGPWARLTPEGYATTKAWHKMNFREATQHLTGSDVFLIIVLACAVLAIVITWSKFYYAAIVPSAIQMAIAVFTYGYYTYLKNRNVGFADIGGIIHSAFILGGLMIAILMLRGYLNGRKKKASADTNKETL